MSKSEFKEKSARKTECFNEHHGLGKRVLLVCGEGHRGGREWEKKEEGEEIKEEEEVGLRTTDSLYSQS